MLKTYRPTTKSQRSHKSLVRDISSVGPEKSLVVDLKKTAGRTNGIVTVRHKGSGVKKLYRIIDFKRNKKDVEGKVLRIEYDPNRGPNIALIVYADGEKRYILAPEGLKEGMKVISGDAVEAIVGNALMLANIPLGTVVHNVEINPGGGGVMIRGAGNGAQLLAKEGDFVNLKLPSGEVKKISGRCYATIGVLGNMDLRNVRLGKAGRNRHMGVRPAVRGVAMGNPAKSHPHAGSYKTTGIGRPAPLSPWGWKTRGVRQRHRRSTDYTIVKSRHSK
jgi:large subunit ribosomal protein L2